MTQFYFFYYATKKHYIIKLVLIAVLVDVLYFYPIGFNVLLSILSYLVFHLCFRGSLFISKHFLEMIYVFAHLLIVTIINYILTLIYCDYTPELGPIVFQIITTFCFWPVVEYLMFYNKKKTYEETEIYNP